MSFDPYTERFARLVDGSTVWGPGLLPRFVQIDNAGYFPRDMSEAELNDIGYMKVNVVGRREYDKGFEEETTPTYSLEAGEPVETYSYQFKPNLEALLLAHVDLFVERQRSATITNLPGQVMEYDRAYMEAKLVMEDDANGLPVPLGKYPYVDADIGITIDPQTGQAVETTLESADLILRTREDAASVGVGLRRLRLDTKAKIRAAVSPQAAYNAFKNMTLSEDVVYADSGETVPTDPNDPNWNPNFYPKV